MVLSIKRDELFYNDLCLCLLLFGSKFTPGEVLAILLHEIGHNFTYVLNTHLVPLNIIDTVYRWTMIIKYNPNKLKALLGITLGSTKWGNQLMHWIVKYRSFPIVDAFVNLGSILLGARRLWLDIINRIEEPLKDIDYIKFIASVFAGNDSFISPSFYMIHMPLPLVLLLGIMMNHLLIDLLLCMDMVKNSLVVY